MSYESVKFKIPAQPLIASIGILSTIHLMCSLGSAAYIRFGACQILGTIYYIWLFYNREFKREREGYMILDVQENVLI